MLRQSQRKLTPPCGQEALPLPVRTVTSRCCGPRRCCGSLPLRLLHFRVTGKCIGLQSKKEPVRRFFCSSTWQGNHMLVVSLQEHRDAKWLVWVLRRWNTLPTLRERVVILTRRNSPSLSPSNDVCTTRPGWWPSSWSWALREHPASRAPCGVLHVCQKLL